MDYARTIDYLFSKLPMFSRVGAAAYKNDLHNTLALCEHLGHPERKIRTLHVAGTNGKGSVSHMLAAILQTAGYKTGLYTSPHLYDFRERIRINGVCIEQRAVTDFTQRMIPLIESIQPSFFELTVAMAFEYFASCQVDIAVIETGLGGRLDSTNVITPLLSVITNIGMDHMQLLGDTFEQIASEKAGIIKRGIPVVIGQSHAATRSVFSSKADREQAPLVWADQLRTIKEYKLKSDHSLITVQSGSGVYQYRLALPGIYQTHNLLTVLEAVAQLKQQGWNISDEDIATGLSQTVSLTGLGGRWQQINSDPVTVAEVAHNEDGMRQLRAQLHHANYGRLHIVLGAVKDKSISNMLALLPTEASYYFTQASLPRALPAADLQQQAKAAGLLGTCYANVNEALHKARAAAAGDDLVLVCGSIFLVAEIGEEHRPFTGNRVRTPEGNAPSGK